MNLERDEYYRDLKNLHEDCKKHTSYHVILTMKDGSVFDGIIEEVDSKRVIVLVGEDVIEQDGEDIFSKLRQPYDYRRPRRRARRFRRRNFPLDALAALTLVQYPYLAPLYPFY